MTFTLFILGVIGHGNLIANSRVPTSQFEIGALGIRVDSRLWKLKMLIFEREDAYAWVYLVEHYFSINHLSKEEKLTVMTLCLEGKALSWF